MSSMKSHNDGTTGYYKSKYDKIKSMQPKASELAKLSPDNQNSASSSSEGMDSHDDNTRKQLLKKKKSVLFF